MHILTNWWNNDILILHCSISDISLFRKCSLNLAILTKVKNKGWWIIVKIKEKINLILVWIFPVIAIWLYPRYKYMSLGKYDMFAAGMYNFYIGNILACLVAIMLIQIWKNLRLWTKWHLLACLCNLVLFGYVSAEGIIPRRSIK